MLETVFLFICNANMQKAENKSVGSANVNSLKIKGSRQNTNTTDILPQVGKMSIGRISFALKEQTALS
ncbi:MAG: hypothetical protein IJC98_06115 [Clostridia bacterium]|nr:hypothetical protein [Clostridia bacterium]